MSAEAELLADIAQVAQASPGKTLSKLWRPGSEESAEAPYENELLASVAQVAQATAGATSTNPWVPPEVNSTPPPTLWPSLPTPPAPQSADMAARAVPLGR